MSDYINVSFGGADGAGTVSCSVDTKKLYERLAGNEKNAVIIRNIDTFVDGISASADATDKLSNGDKVTISVLYDRSLADKIGCRVAGAKFAVEVSGLGDGSVIDIFANVEVVVAGISPDAYANVLNKWQDDRLKNIAFTLDKATGIKAGDVITVTCEASAEELAEQGISIAESRKQFHVDRVACYADSVQALDMNVIDNIIGECKDAIKTETEDLTFRMLIKRPKTVRICSSIIMNGSTALNLWMPYFCTDWIIMMLRMPITWIWYSNPISPMEHRHLTSVLYLNSQIL